MSDAMPAIVYFDGGEVEYVSLTQSRLGSFLDIIRRVILRNFDGPIFDRILTIEQHHAQQGVSIIAVHKPTDEVIGVAANYIESIREWSEQYDNLELGSYLGRELKQVSNFLHITSLAVLPEFRGRGVGTKLCQSTLRLAERLKNGDLNSKLPVSSDFIKQNALVQAVSAEFATCESRAIGRRLNFTTLRYGEPWMEHSISYIVL